MFSAVKRAALGMGLMMIAMSVVTCANKKASDHVREDTMTVKPIEEVLREHTKELMSLPGVVGTALGLCDSRHCIKVYVVKKTRELDRKISNRLAGYPVEIEETGKIRALPKNKD